jgi:hypothetical protein
MRISTPVRKNPLLCLFQSKDAATFVRHVC